MIDEEGGICMSCRTLNDILKNTQTGQYKISHQSCHMLSCPICFSEQKSVLKKVITYCVSSYILFFPNLVKIITKTICVVETVCWLRTHHLFHKLFDM